MRFWLYVACVVLLVALGLWAGGVIDFGEGISVPIMLGSFAAACYVAAGITPPSRSP